MIKIIFLYRALHSRLPRAAKMLLPCLSITTFSFAQNSTTISGRPTDTATGAALPGVTVGVKGSNKDLPVAGVDQALPGQMAYLKSGGNKEDSMFVHPVKIGSTEICHLKPQPK